MKVECPFCKEVYNVKRSQLGKQATCHMCEQTFVLYVEGVEPLPPRKKNPKALLHALLGLVVLLALGGGGYGAYWYFKVYRPQQQEKTAAENTDNGGTAQVKAITQADMVSSQNNLKQIFKGFEIGSFSTLPESLSVLLENNHLPEPKVFIAPFDKVSTPGDGKINPGNTTYAYVGEGFQKGRPVVIAFEKPWLLPDGSNQINVLLADGTVHTKTIQDVSKKSCREIVEILTADYSDKTTVEKLLKNADREDANRNSGTPKDGNEANNNSPENEVSK